MRGVTHESKPSVSAQIGNNSGLSESLHRLRIDTWKEYACCSREFLLGIKAVDGAIWGHAAVLTSLYDTKRSKRHSVVAIPDYRTGVLGQLPPDIPAAEEDDDQTHK